MSLVLVERFLRRDIYRGILNYMKFLKGKGNHISVLGSRTRCSKVPTSREPPERSE